MAKVTSIRLSDHLAEQIEQLAASLDRPKSWLIEQAISRYVEEEAAQIAAISEALEAHRAGTGSTRSHEEVMAGIEERLRAGSRDGDPVA